MAEVSSGTKHIIRMETKIVTANETITSLKSVSLAIVLCLAGAASTAFAQANQPRTPGQAPEGTLMAAATPAPAAASPKAKDEAAKSDTTVLEEELDELRGVVDQQARQLDVQSEQLKEQQAQMQTLLEQLKSMTTGASPAQATPGSTAAPATAAIAAAAPAMPAVAAMPAPAAIPPAAQAAEPKLGPIAIQNFKIGATFFGNFTHYTNTGFSPAFQDAPSVQLAPPGNNGLNIFDVTRAYVNFLYTPDQHVTLRITPDIYRQADSSYTLRLKYGFVDIQKVFGNGALKDTKITFGQTTQPLTDWEEGLSGYRYAYLTPWNYLSLSSTYAGAKIHGPISSNGKEYLDYDIGVFNTASFHAIETNDKKQFMGRLTFYPLGTKADRTGLGFTIFDDYGYNTKLPSQVSTALNRMAVLVHYQTFDKAYQIAFEYQNGRNAVSTGNLFGGSGAPASGAGAPYATFSADAAAALAGTHTKQQGFDFYGRARLGKSSWQLFGLFQYFQPNTAFVPSSIGLTDNPLDFERTVGGISYKVTNAFDVSFGDQNFHWVHPQGLAGTVDTNGVVIWTQFNF
jgi:TolA-binding protein